MPNNTRLVEYGIQNEQSDIRAHVSMLAGYVYVYRTEDGRSIVKTGKYTEKPAYTEGMLTAKGYVVPPRDIPGIKAVKIPDIYHNGIKKTDSTSEKGRKAVEIVSYLLLNGLFPLTTQPVVVSEKDMQIQGTDITIHMQARIQVKCDLRAGSKKHNALCTGNLFLQFAECNPFQQY